MADPRAEGLAQIEVRSIDQVPPGERHGRIRDQFTLWFGLNANIFPVVLGGSEIAGAATDGIHVWDTLSGKIVESYAAEAGLEAGDVITSFAGHSVPSAAALSSTLTHDRPGTKVLLTWVAVAGGSYSAQVTLGTGPAG